MPEQAEFDPYKDTYQDEVAKSTAFVRQERDFFTEIKVGHLVDLSQRHHGDPSTMKILDVGCGVGSTGRHLRSHFGFIHGLDPSSACIQTAKRDVPEISFQVGSGTAIPHDDNSLDLVFAICVMHHVPPHSWIEVAREMQRVIKPGGWVVIFEHNPYNPLTRLAVNRCEFDKDAVLLSMETSRKLLQQAALQVVEQKYILFFPFKHALFPFLERGLTWLPLGAQYYVLGQKPRQA